MRRDWKESKEFEQVPEPLGETKRNRFPKKIGIIFLEEIVGKRSLLAPRKKAGGSSKTRLAPNKSKIFLNFDQLACAHLLLQMNFIQSSFDFQIISHDYELYSNLPRKSDWERRNKLLEWFNGQISRFEKEGGNDDYGIDYWIGITSENLPSNREFKLEKSDKSGKIFSLITTDIWETINSPPSVFEYIAITVLICSLISVSLEFNGSLGLHAPLATKGCIFDFTSLKPQRRILVSNPGLCNICKGRLLELQRIIKNATGKEIPIYENTLLILSRDWMGSLEKKDSPIYNLKKNYGYNVDVNSGFYKKWWEYARDNIKENTMIWIVTGLIGMIFVLIGNLFTNVFNLSPK